MRLIAYGLSVEHLYHDLNTFLRPGTWRAPCWNRSSSGTYELIVFAYRLMTFYHGTWFEYRVHPMTQIIHCQFSTSLKTVDCFYFARFRAIFVSYTFSYFFGNVCVYIVLGNLPRQYWPFTFSLIDVWCLICECVFRQMNQKGNNYGCHAYGIAWSLSKWWSDAEYVALYKNNIIPFHNFK